MKGIKVLGIAVALLLIIAVSGNAAAQKWDVDKDHSGFHFSITHIFAKVHGFFNDFDVEMQFDPDDLETSRMVFTIKVASVDTNIAKRDQHLQSADFFEADKYPIMKFTSTKITRTGENTYDVAGKFEVKGVSYDLVLPLVYGGVRDNPMVKGKLVTGFNGGVTIDRLYYKVGSGKFVDMGIVGKDVDIEVNLELLADK